MQRRASPIRLLALGSVLLLAPSCDERPKSAGNLSPPVDLLQRANEPPMTPEALTSEQAYERDRTAKIEWGRDNANIIDRACQWFTKAGVKGLNCR